MLLITERSTIELTRTFDYRTQQSNWNVRLLNKILFDNRTSSIIRMVLVLFIKVSRKIVSLIAQRKLQPRQASPWFSSEPFFLSHNAGLHSVTGHRFHNWTNLPLSYAITRSFKKNMSTKCIFLDRESCIWSTSLFDIGRHLCGQRFDGCIVVSEGWELMLKLCLYIELFTKWLYC